MLAGELCDWGDSYFAAGAAPPTVSGPPRVEPAREGEEIDKKAEVKNEEDNSKASAAKKEVSKAHQGTKERERKDPSITSRIWTP